MAKNRYELPGDDGSILLEDILDDGDEESTPVVKQKRKAKPAKKDPLQREKPAKVCKQRRVHLQHEARVNDIIGILARSGYSPDRHICNEIAQKYGISHRHSWRLIGEAKQHILSRSGKARDEHIADVLNVFHFAIQSGDLKLMLKAADLKAKLLGLNAPKTVQLQVENPLTHYERQQALVADDDVIEAAMRYEEAVASSFDAKPAIEPEVIVVEEAQGEAKETAEDESWSIQIVPQVPEEPPEPVIDEYSI